MVYSLSPVLIKRNVQYAFHIPEDYFDICISLEHLETGACSWAGPLARLLSELPGSPVLEAEVKK